MIVLYLYSCSIVAVLRVTLKSSQIIIFIQKIITTKYILSLLDSIFVSEQRASENEGGEERVFRAHAAAGSRAGEGRREIARASGRRAAVEVGRAAAGEAAGREATVWKRE